MHHFYVIVQQEEQMSTLFSLEKAAIRHYSVPTLMARVLDK
jgi:hypothetical protein